MALACRLFQSDDEQIERGYSLTNTNVWLQSEEHQLLQQFW